MIQFWVKKELGEELILDPAWKAHIQERFVQEIICEIERHHPHGHGRDLRS
jgi:hypothetical protein